MYPIEPVTQNEDKCRVKELSLNDTGFSLVFAL